MLRRSRHTCICSGHGQVRHALALVVKNNISVTAPELQWQNIRVASFWWQTLSAFQSCSSLSALLYCSMYVICMAITACVGNVVFQKHIINNKQRHRESVCLLKETQIATGPIRFVQKSSGKMLLPAEMLLACRATWYGSH